MKKRNLLRKLTIQQSIILCVIVVSLIPQLFLVSVFYRNNRDMLIKTNCEKLSELLASSNTMLDEQLRQIQVASKNILIDDLLFNFFMSSEDVSVLHNATLDQYYINYNDQTSVTDRWYLTRTMYKYFGNIDIVSDIEIATHKNCYVYEAQRTNYDLFWGSDVHSELTANNGGILWAGRQRMRAYEVENSYLSCMRLMNMRKVEFSGVGTYMPEDCERPILRILLSDDYIHRILGMSVAGIDRACYSLLAENGEVLLGGGYSLLKDQRFEMLFGEKEKGLIKVEGADGQPVIVCFNRLERCGWTSVAAFSEKAISGPLDRQLKFMFIAIVIIQVLTSVLAALFAARMIRVRLFKINCAVNEVKTGHYTWQITDEYKDEFSPLVNNINEMGQSLRKLIDENLKVSLREQESRLQTLMAQLNPHYIYNSLNVINWVALRENARRSSSLIVSLSKMLRYTSNNREENTVLSEDIAWMENYFKLMEARFTNLYTVEWDVAEDCLSLRLPKLFMQPLVENSILHGFGDRTEGGRIRIHIHREGSNVICVVEDNGCGMSEQQAQDALEGRTKSIGLYNVHRRIQMACGPEYGVSISSGAEGGTCATLRMCIQTEEL